MASPYCVCWDYETPDIECTCEASNPWHMVDTQGHVIATYRTRSSAESSLLDCQSIQARNGLRSGELDYKTCKIVSA